MTSSNKSKKGKKVGRPRVPKDEAHSHIIPVRFKNDDLKAFQKAAEKNGQTLSEWIRETLRNALNLSQ